MKRMINCFLSFLLILLIFSDYISIYYIPSFSYLDEIIVLMLSSLAVIKIIYNHGYNNLSKEEKLILILHVFLFVLGLIGNLLSGYQNYPFAIFMDIFSLLKFFGVYLCSVIWFQGENDDDSNDKSLLFIVDKLPRIIIIISIIVEFIIIINGMFSYGIDYNTGIRVFAYGSHAYFASAILACTISVLSINIKKNKWYILAGSILLLLTMRAKAYGFIALLVFSLIIFKRRIKMKRLLYTMPIILLIVRKKIYFYFFSTFGIRGLLLRTSLKIANNFFPFGSGFASFGTVMSGMYYSLAYVDYGLHNFWGLSRYNHAFITDGGWASMIAQTGYVGTILFIIMIILLVRTIKKKYKKTNKIPFLLLLGYLLIASTNENAFSSNYTILFSIFIAAMLIYSKDVKE